MGSRSRRKGCPQASKASGSHPYHESRSGSASCRPRRAPGEPHVGAEVAVTTRRAITTCTPAFHLRWPTTVTDSIRRCRPQNTAEETDGQTETPDESVRARRRKPTFCSVPISHRGNQLLSPARGGARPLFTEPPSLPTARSRPCRSN